jgi:hypothetical protein
MLGKRMQEEIDASAMIERFMGAALGLCRIIGLSRVVLGPLPKS